MNNEAIIEIESDLLQAFRFRDRKHVHIPAGMKFPLTFKNYLTWSEPTGMYQYLVFRKHGDQELVGLVFDRSDAGRLLTATQMCNWCQTSGPSDQIDMLTVSPTSRTVVGVVLCIDLSCQEKLENVAKLSRKSLDRLVQDVMDRMTLFYERKFENP